MMIRIRHAESRFKMVKAPNRDRLTAASLSSLERSDLRDFVVAFSLLSFLAAIALAGLALTLLKPFPANLTL